ncbi:MAG TPA: acylneuraminate cytidylyltransferase family protein [Bacteroidetes bacterium]|nr:acylneuraminate cytidylyltransferase family protein [Bacteroidota bacterium]
MPDIVTALIPARGGSKGIPRKNLLQLLGKPLISYTIKHALDSNRIDRVIVSTDDPEIAEVSRRYGAEAPFLRPDEFARDGSPDIDVFRHYFNWIRENGESLPDMVVHLRPTNPVRRIELIDDAVDLLAHHPEADAVRSVTLAEQTPYKMWRIDADGTLKPLLRLEGVKDCQSIPRQRLPIVYWQNGYVDVIRPRAVMEKNSMWGEVVLPLIVEEHMFELDYPENIPPCEAALKRLQAGTLERLDRSGRHPV